MVSTFFHKAYLDVVDKYRSIEFNSSLNVAFENEELKSSELASHQEELLLSLIKHVRKNVKKYKGVFNEVFDSRSMHETFDSTPLLSKTDLIRNRAEHISEIYPGKKFSGTTSGSTGNSLQFEFDSSHIAWVEASKWRARSWYGAKRGDKVYILWGRPIVDGKFLPKLSNIKSLLRNEVHFNTFSSLNDEYCEKLWVAIKKSKPKFVYGYGSSIATLAKYAFRKGCLLGEHEAPAFIQYTADHMSSQEKDITERVFCAPVISDYGGSEIAGIASECRHGFLHISADHCLVEIVDPESNKRLSSGEVGEIVVTALHNYRMPLIRYRIGDLGRLIDGACSCGSVLPRMELVAGKAVDLINTSYSNRISSHYLDYINIKIMKEGLFGIEQFQVIQTSCDDFHLKIVAGSHEAKNQSVNRFCDLLREKLGNISIQIEEVENIPVEPSGKRKYFIKKISDQNCKV